MNFYRYVGIIVLIGVSRARGAWQKIKGITCYSVFLA